MPDLISIEIVAGEVSGTEERPDMFAIGHGRGSGRIAFAAVDDAVAMS